MATDRPAPAVGEGARVPAAAVDVGGVVDTTVRVGSVALPNPVMTASGTSGHGAELAPYLDLGALGAVVVKSLHVGPWAGNPPLRVHETAAGMINSVGLQGPGVAAWAADDLPGLAATGARVVASIWGRTVDEYAAAARALVAALDGPDALVAPGGDRGGAPGAGRSVVAVEVNLSCPNTESARHLFAHSAADTAAVVRAVTAVTAPTGRPAWAKLSAGTPDLVDVAAAAHEAGAEAVTLVNTVLGMAIDPETRRFRLGAGARGGGLSGPAIHPVAVRATFDVHRARPDLPIVGVGGVAGGADAAELLLAGASAVQVGTATFADPRAPARVRDELTAWAGRQGVGRIAELTGAVLEAGGERPTTTGRHGHGLDDQADERGR